MIERFAPGNAEQWNRIEEIFFLSASVQCFRSAADRQRFAKSWTGYYRDREPDLIFVQRSSGGPIAGYLMGCRDSAQATPLFKDIPSYALFSDMFNAYPGHFHVNCHPNFRNLGVGTELVTEFLAFCRESAIPGVHIVTANGARNVGFYEKLGFGHTARRPWRDRELLFMGQFLK